MKHVNKKRRGLLVAILVAVFIWEGIAYCQNPLKKIAPKRITAAGPRLGPGAIIELKSPTREQLQELTQQGYNFEFVGEQTFRIYATQDELNWLNKAGYDYQVIQKRIVQRGETFVQPERYILTGLGGYHNYTELTTELETYANNYPEICRLYTLGQSVQGRELWAMLITDNPDKEEDEPEFKYISTMHGDEPIGTEMCLYFINKLLTEYNANPDPDGITDLVDTTAIWIVPVMNPDGLDLVQRENANGYDLNRLYPAFYPPHLGQNGLPWVFKENIFHGPALYTASFEPELAHIINWSVKNSFVLSASFHSGIIVVYYPYGDNISGQGGDYYATPDDGLYIDISKRYTYYNPDMWNSTQYDFGICNGVDDYTIRGCMMEWEYRYASDNFVAPELSIPKKPPEAQLPDYWADNEYSMLNYLKAVHIGIRGIVTDSVTGKPIYAEVWVEDNYQPVYTDPDIGDYHRMLLPGTYDLIFYAPGYKTYSVENVTVIDGPATRVDVELVPGNIDPVGHWKLDEGQGNIAYDSAGSNNGTIHGATWTTGQIGGALSFNGNEDYVSLSSSIPALGGSYVTISAWIKTDTLSGWDPIFTQYDSSEEGYYLYLSSGRPAFYLNGGSAAISGAAIETDEWHHVAGTYNSSLLKIYVNGCLKNTLDLEDSSGSGSAAAYIGRGAGESDDHDYFDGLIDDVRVYNRALHVSDIWEIMYPDTSKFSVKNASGVRVAWFDDSGNLFLRGNLEQGEGNPPEREYADGFRFKDSSDDDVAIIDNISGNMYIKGTYTKNTWQDPSTSPHNFIINNSSGSPVAYISNNGNLYLTGKLYEGNP